MVARLAADPPADALGVVVYSGATTTALLFAPTSGRSRTVPLYAQPGRCGFHVPGAMPPRSGATVTLAFVDGWGRLSARSGPITVR